MTFDIRVVVSRASLDEHLTQLSWYLMGGYPVALGLAALTGIWLIRRAVHPVEQAFDRERRFAWAASHELRSPLTALRGEIELALRRERSSAEYVAALRRIQPVVGRMTSLVEGLLVLARARSGQLLLGVGETTVADLLGTTEDLLRVLPDQERVQVTINVPADARFLGDRLLLATALRNLIENSLRYAPPATPVEVTIEAAGDQQLQFIVIDHGPGLPESLLKKGLAGTTEPGPTSQGGTGLGLAIVHAIVEAHQGRLTLTNLPESGCRADITLPALSTLTEVGTMNRRAVDARPLPELEPELEPQLHAD
jgi:two-component system OmpR family sensor kinase